MPLSDTEVLATFMEKTPAESPGWYGETNTPWPDWWEESEPWGDNIAGEWQPCDITLNECREIEMKLTGPQWHGYKCALFSQYADQTPSISDLISLEAAQKIAALSIVLRPIVEAPNAA